MEIAKSTALSASRKFGSCCIEHSHPKRTEMYVACPGSTHHVIRPAKFTQVGGYQAHPSQCTSARPPPNPFRNTTGVYFCIPLTLPPVLSPSLALSLRVRSPRFLYSRTEYALQHEYTTKGSVPLDCGSDIQATKITSEQAQSAPPSKQQPK